MEGEGNGINDGNETNDDGNETKGEEEGGSKRSRKNKHKIITRKTFIILQRSP